LKCTVIETVKQLQIDDYYKSFWQQLVMIGMQQCPNWKYTFAAGALPGKTPEKCKHVEQKS